MTINNNDIKFRQSERMTDNPDGGGQMSKNVIVDGDMNNVFSDSSDLDAILGRVSLRKVYMHVDTANTDTLLGSFVFLTDPPDDPLVEVSLFNTASFTDERLQAQSYVEAYRLKASKTQYILYANHVAGQTMIQVFCRTNIATPDIGDVFALSVEKVGYTPSEQFVQVKRVVSRQTYTFTDGDDFQRDVIIIEITAPLLQNFEGKEDPSRNDSVNSQQSPTKIRFTTIANGASYYTVKNTVLDAEAGDTLVKVSTPYVQIMPSGQAETPVTDLLAGLGTLSYVKSGADASLTVSGAISAAPDVSVNRYFGTPYAVRTLNMTVGVAVLKDDGNGNIVADPPDSTWSGTADYATGSFSLSRSTGISGALSASATPAGVIPVQGYSAPLPITAANRQSSYVFQIPGSPAPGSVILDYRALGNWIRLYDNGAGLLLGETGQGSGPINYSTGSVAVTLGGLPDVDSSIILSWGTTMRAKNSSGDLTVPTPVMTIVPNHDGVLPATLEMTWTSSGVDKIATSDFAGDLTGDATGKFDYIGNVLGFTTSVPATDGIYTLSYDRVDPTKVHTENFSPPAVSSVITFTTAQPIRPGSLGVGWWLSWSPPNATTNRKYYQKAHVTDDGAGHFMPATGDVDYATGIITLRAE